MDQVRVGLSLQEQKATNQDITVEFTPKEGVIRCEYILYKNNEILEKKEATSSFTTVMDTTGIYRIEVTEYFSFHEEKVVSGEYQIDKEKPVLEIKESLITLHKGDVIDLYGGVKATDEQSGDLTRNITTNYDSLDFSTLGVKRLEYTVIDEAGNSTTQAINVNVIRPVSPTLFVFQIGIVIVFLVCFFLFQTFRRSIRLEKRISKYSIDPIRDNSVSFYDQILTYYHKFIYRFSLILQKSVFLQKYGTKYDKYLAIADSNYQSGIDFVTTKGCVAILFVLIALFAKTLQSQMLSIYEICIPLLVGFFVPDVFYLAKYKLHRRKLENDLLQAIIIMNNAFKSGRSISQAVFMVTTELEGPICEEFKKMHLELNFGLGVDVVFQRFSDRIQLEEVTYLTASLSILNKTGGNIIKVFSSIEKSLFNKKKLNLELQALIGSSKLIVYILFLVPIFFIVLVSIINPAYFVPFFTTTVGIILLMIVVVFYVLYIVIVRKVMRVRM